MMATIPKGADEELWYHQIVKNFALPRDEDLAAQSSGGAGELTNLGIGPEKKKHVPTTVATPKKSDAPRALIAKAKIVREGKKGTRLFLKPRSNYVVVSDTLEGLAPVVIKKPKPKAHDIANIPASNPDEPIDLDSSPEPLVRTKAVKRKQAEVEAAAQPAKKVLRRKIGKKGNLDAFVTKLSPEKSIPSVRAESSSVFIDDLPPSSPRASIREQVEGTKAVEMEAYKVAEVKKPEEVEKLVEVELEAEKIAETEAVDVGVTQPKFPEVLARELKKGKSIQEDPVITIPFSTTTSTPVHVEKSPAGDQGFFTHAEEDSPIRLEETLGDYYYRSYSEKRASDIHSTVWKLKQGDTFSDWQVCRDWLQGVFLYSEVKFQEERSHDQTYHAYLEETVSLTSTTHRIVHEWLSMHKEWVAFEASKKEVSEEKA
ncbi:hypothetical protein HanRHA438_Chr03g0101281 [Helianthus annuus]|uniref:Uncharacterized protein n=1 Tax=Helianthus annuus TaxID=4232 RepID=A0A9K3NV99_HELAN|nr:hypothetical protein HanXRQr2_Chr03g0089951 [Helianthus annuus]KAJ0495919.1 hypothetical protein HanIR_Chr12g0614311 [Helianthus annuus]KAJ0591655.1 hypothetical protein HanHA300_Chr03g0075741 [Helianthus annuus]KAJ0606554.1 hypothetical protein HanHA89_Chr03g0086451 [Helianthus annuus]KAJ0933894.1 hypothetical protein HanRHA438_Chr03g0101281 [Helianthus annuus]